MSAKTCGNDKKKRPAVVDPPVVTPEPTTVLPLAEVERKAVIHALKVSANNVTEAARALGLNRATLYRKLKKYDLPAGN